MARKPSRVAAKKKPPADKGKSKKNPSAAKMKKAEQDFLAVMKKLAADRGIELHALIPTAKPKKKRKKAKSAPKYRHPDDASKTWTGRGRTPAWAKPYKDAGTLEKIEIAD